VRRRHGGCGGGSGGDGSGGGGSVAAKTTQLGVDDKRPTLELEQVRWKATLDTGLWWTPLAACALASCTLEEESVGFVDSAREKNKARAVVEI